MELNSRKIAYVADLAQDIDDMIAIEYLNSFGLLGCVIYDASSIDREYYRRLGLIEELHIPLIPVIPADAEVIFCGGSLAPIAKYLEMWPTDWTKSLGMSSIIKALVINGGFVGNNIITNGLPKFKDKEYARTYNFNMDVDATKTVLDESNLARIEEIILVGKAVCHSKRNTINGLWNSELFLNLQKKYKFDSSKLLHDVLMCHEGLALLKLIDDKPYCNFMDLCPKTESNILNGKDTKWGSAFIGESPNTFRKCFTAIGFGSE